MSRPAALNWLGASRAFELSASQSPTLVGRRRSIRSRRGDLTRAARCVAAARERATDRCAIGPDDRGRDRGEEAERKRPDLVVDEAVPHGPRNAPIPNPTSRMPVIRPRCGPANVRSGPPRASGPAGPARSRPPARSSPSSHGRVGRTDARARASRAVNSTSDSTQHPPEAEPVDQPAADHRSDRHHGAPGAGRAGRQRRREPEIEHVGDLMGRHQHLEAEGQRWRPGRSRRPDARTRPAPVSAEPSPTCAAWRGSRPGASQAASGQQHDGHRPARRASVVARQPCASTHHLDAWADDERAEPLAHERHAERRGEARAVPQREQS